MPHVPEIKTADVCILISLRNLLVRRTTWLVPKTTSPTSISSSDFGAYYMTRILYKYVHLPTLTLFSHFHSQGQHTLSSVTSRENTLTLSISTNRVNTLFLFLHLTSDTKMDTSATILFLVILCRWDFFQPRTQKFRQTAKRNKQ